MAAGFDYKQYCLWHVREERARWDALLAQVGGERMLRPGALGE